MTDKPVVYLAGPVAHTENANSWRTGIKKSHGDEYEFLDPLNKYDVPTDDLEVVDDYVTDDPTKVAVDEIVENDKEMIERCDGVLVGYEPVRSVGTPMEVMFAYARNIPVTIWKQYGEQKLSPWYRYHAEEITPNPGIALSVLKAHIPPKTETNHV